MTPTPDQQALTSSLQGSSDPGTDPASVAAILSASLREYQAKLKFGATNPQGNFVKVGPIPLDNAPANPIKLPSPLKAVHFKDATDNTVRVSLIINSDAKFNVDMAYPLDLNDSLSFGDPVPLAFLTWLAQPGKTATLYFAIDADIRSGRMNLIQSGGVSIQEGLAATSLAGVAVTNVATSILAADSTRNVVVIENQGGAPIYLGDATVTVPGGAKPGITLNPGSTYEWRNAGALYGITGGANQSVALLQLK